MAKNKHTESLQGPRIRISGLTREPVFPKASKKLVDRNKTAMLHPLKEFVLRNASNSRVFILCQCFRRNSQP